MRIFTPEEERAVLRQGRLRLWAGSKLLTEDQRKAAEAKLGRVRKTASMPVRLLFGGFTCVLLAGACGVAALLLLWLGETTLAVAAAAAAYYAGESMIRGTDHYRFGVEEALLFFSLAAAAGATLTLMPGRSSDGLHGSAASLVVALGGVWLFLRFGYFAGILAVAGGAAAFGGFLDLGEKAFRVYLLVACAGGLGLSWMHEPSEIDRGAWEAGQGLLLIGAALAVNLRVESLFSWTSAPKAPDGGAWYWTTLLLTAVVPAAGLWLGVAKRHRALLWAGALTAALCCATLKPYLGLSRHLWDPAVFGALLAGLAWYLQRALAAKPDGFTAEELTVAKPSGLEGAAYLAASVGAGGPAPGRPSSGFGGGTSGGGGASDAF